MEEMLYKHLIETGRAVVNNNTSISYGCLCYHAFSAMIALTLFASQSKQIIIKILDLKDILGLYCGIKVVIQCQIVDFTLSQYLYVNDCL